MAVCMADDVMTFGIRTNQTLGRPVGYVIVVWIFHAVCSLSSPGRSIHQTSQVIPFRHMGQSYLQVCVLHPPRAVLLYLLKPTPQGVLRRIFHYFTQAVTANHSNIPCFNSLCGETTQPFIYFMNTLQHPTQRATKHIMHVVRAQVNTAGALLARIVRFEGRRFVARSF